MITEDRISTKTVKIRLAYDWCRQLYQKLESLDRSSKRSAHSYNLVKGLIDKINKLVDESFNVPVKKRIQRDLKKVMVDINSIGYDEL